MKDQKKTSYQRGNKKKNSKVPNRSGGNQNHNTKTTDNPQDLFITGTSTRNLNIPNAAGDNISKAELIFDLAAKLFTNVDTITQNYIQVQIEKYAAARGYVVSSGLIVSNVTSYFAAATRYLSSVVWLKKMFDVSQLRDSRGNDISKVFTSGTADFIRDYSPRVTAIPIPTISSNIYNISNYEWVNGVLGVMNQIALTPETIGMVVALYGSFIDLGYRTPSNTSRFADIKPDGYYNGVTDNVPANLTALKNTLVSAINAAGPDLFPFLASIGITTEVASSLSLDRDPLGQTIAISQDPNLLSAIEGGDSFLTIENESRIKSRPDGYLLPSKIGNDFINFKDNVLFNLESLLPYLATTYMGSGNFSEIEKLFISLGNVIVLGDTYQVRAVPVIAPFRIDLSTTTVGAATAAEVDIAHNNYNRLLFNYWEYVGLEKTTLSLVSPDFENKVNTTFMHLNSVDEDAYVVNTSDFRMVLNSILPMITVGAMYKSVLQSRTALAPYLIK